MKHPDYDATIIEKGLRRLDQGLKHEKCVRGTFVLRSLRDQHFTLGGLTQGTFFDG